MGNKKKTTIGIRLASMLVDHIIMTIAICISIFPFMIIEMSNVFIISHDQTSVEPTFMLYVCILGFVICFNKDFFNGRSPAKRILKLQVINNKTNEIASPLKCLLRNLTIPIWPLEVIFILINPQRRLGDYIAGTRIEIFDQENIKFKRKFKDYVLPLSIGLLFASLITLPFLIPIKSMDQRVNYISDSYNPKLSNELSTFLSYRLRDYNDSSNVRLYDKTKNDSLKYISLLFYISNEDLLESSQKFSDLKQMIIDTLDLEIPQNSFILKGKIIFKVPGHIHIRYLDYNPRMKEIKKLGSISDYRNDSVKVIKAFYRNGHQKSEAVYVNGKLSGTYKEWFENGSIRIEIEYVNGMRNGLTTTYYSNGQKMSEMLYKDNSFIKDINKWDEMGNKVLIENQ